VKSHNTRRLIPRDLPDPPVSRGSERSGRGPGERHIDRPDGLPAGPVPRRRPPLQIRRRQM